MQENNPFYQIKKYLKSYITNNGFDSLKDDAYDIYEDVLKEDLLDESYAGALLLSLLSDIRHYVQRSKNDVDKLAKILSKNCLLSLNVCVDLAEMYLALFSQENCAKWEKLKYSGLNDFCETDWELSCVADGLVQRKDKTCLECSLHASVQILPSDKTKIDATMHDILQYNPFISAEYIYEYYLELFEVYVNELFQDILDEEDYYFPSIESDHEMLEDYIQDFCYQHGFSFKDIHVFYDPNFG